MKEIFEDIVDRLSDAAETVGKRADEVIETQKVKSKIRALEKNNRRDFRDLGRMLYEKYKSGEVIDGDYLELCEVIEERENEIAACEAELENIKED